MNETIYSIVVQYKDGGQNMKCFENKESATIEGEKVAKLLKDANRSDIKVYLSELPYNKHKNVIPSCKLINSKSKLLY